VFCLSPRACAVTHGVRLLHARRVVASVPNYRFHSSVRSRTQDLQDQRQEAMTPPSGKQRFNQQHNRRRNFKTLRSIMSATFSLLNLRAHQYIDGFSRPL